MSTTSTTATSTPRSTATPTDTVSATVNGTEQDLAPAAVFDRVAFHNAGVCSHCFSRIKEVEHITVAHGAVGTRERRLDTRVEDGVPGHGEVADGVFAPRTFCETCGSQSGRALDDTLSQRQAVTFARTLADRLQEVGVDIDESFLADAVRTIRRDPRTRGLDTETFRVATKYAVIHTA
ncbi:hypothetical protein Hbl1158_10090 [Halobaculum sp. CBA1158]|uniref:hypothetical protein n=1 Tax=Halobaculum sp. CBA1158 TaxID=2904243 RepID=UPI001F3CB4A7|nr:hypothetical protein [Halobaculum sp. CBA1158]UIO98883.1 hypothetical protein Hbl1158_10090 [Halobaculum sp. CBA1158]